MIDHDRVALAFCCHRRLCFLPDFGLKSPDKFAISDLRLADNIEKRFGCGLLFGRQWYE